MIDLISIIVPVYNKEKYLPKCIDSIINQSYSNIEIVLVDDGSTDKSPDLCDKYSAKDSRIKVIHRENGGLSAARNTGIENAHGRYLMFVDSDDWVADDFCEAALNSITENDSDIAVFGFSLVEETDGRITKTKKYQKASLDNAEALKQLLTDDIQNYVWNKIFKASLFSEIRFANGKLWEDLEIMYRLFLEGRKIALCDKCTYFYVSSSSSITKNISAKALEDIFTSRYARHLELYRRGYQGIAEKGIGDLLGSALSLYDRSLKEKVHPEILAAAQDVLRKNIAVALESGARFKLYFKAKFLYDLLIKIRQILGKLYRLIKSGR